MAEWLYEAGIGEARAALVEDGRIIEARIEREGEGPRLGAILEARLAEPGTLMALAEVPVGKPIEPVRDILLKTVEELGTPDKAPTAEEVARAQAELDKDFSLLVNDSERLAAQGIDYLRFRNNLRDQIMLQRLREREVQSRIRITEAEIEQFLTAQRGQSAGNVQYNIAQILVAVPEGASAEQQAERRARANQVLAQARSGTSSTMRKSTRMMPPWVTQTDGEAIPSMKGRMRSRSIW